MSGFNIDWLSATDPRSRMDITSQNASSSNRSHETVSPSFQSLNPQSFSRPTFPSSVDNFLSPRLPEYSPVSRASASPGLSAPAPVHSGVHHTSSTTDLGSTDGSHRHHRSYLSAHVDNRAQSNSVDSFMGPPSAGALYSSDDDASIPLSLTAQELTLEESKTYMRWYSDILVRVSSRTATMSDVLGFLSNFKITSQVLDKIKSIFYKIHHSINIGEFFALLRLVGHALNGVEPLRRLIKVPAPVPIPPSILSKKRQKEDDDSDDGRDDSHKAFSQPDAPKKPLDLDSFTQFLLTGERPDEEPVRSRRSKKLKSVKFCDEVEVTESIQAEPNLADPLQAPPMSTGHDLTMDQLLNRLKTNPSPLPLQPAPVDEPPSEQLLRPNHTGPAQMQEYFNLGPQLLKPNMTGPTRMAEYYQNLDASDRAGLDVPLFQSDGHLSSVEPAGNPKISLQLFTDQMTGNTLSNTLQNSRAAENPGASLPPPVPNTRRTRSTSTPGVAPTSRSPEPILPEFLHASQTPPGTFRGPLLPHRDVYLASAAKPAEIIWPTKNDAVSITTPSLRDFQSGSQRRQAPPPPPSRRRVASPNPPPPALPPKVALQQLSWPAPAYTPAASDQDQNSTAHLLDDLRALQEEVDRIGNMTGGF